MKQTKLRETIEELSFGLLSTAINFAVSLVVLGTTISTSRKSPVSVWTAVEQASYATGISKASLRQAFWRAQHKGLISRRRKKGAVFWTATKLGKERLSSKLPIYHSHRPWDKKIYLVTYDIPEEKRYHREKLRQKLIKLGAGKFQQSVYLMLWDPSEVLRKFIINHDLKGQVIVSDTGTDGSIGEKDLDQLLWEVFKLEELNERYRELLKEAEIGDQNSVQLAFLYLSILADDPQLPFELLGPNWLGDKAYKKFKQITKTPENIFLSDLRPHFE